MSVVSVMSDLSSVFVRICPKDVGSVCYMYPHLFFCLIWYKPGITNGLSANLVLRFIECRQSVPHSLI